MTTLTVLFACFVAGNGVCAKPSTDQLSIKNHQSARAAATDLTLMEGYERYLKEPKFMLNPTRIA